MRQHLRACLLASSLIAVTAMPIFSAPAQAQIGVDISFNGFHNELRNYGDWLYSDRWGEVWRPMQQDRYRDWRPYTVGHWVYTDEYGWAWDSDENGWGDVVYHYGRWVYDPDAGWLWMPGYVWSPAWVVWRSAGRNVGWMPMPPDRDFLGTGNGGYNNGGYGNRRNGNPGISVSISFGDWDNINGYYGYSSWYGPRFNDAQFGAMWTFVPAGRVADPGFRRYAVPQQQVSNIVRSSRNVTNYTVVNNVIINRSVNINIVQQGGGRPIQPVRAATAFRDTRWIAPVNQGVQVQAQMRQAAPVGNGVVNSAPRPTPAQVQTLSDRAVPVRNPGNGGPNGGPNGAQNAGPNGGQPPHIFTRATVAQAQTQPAPNNGAPPRQGPQQAPAPAQPNPPPPQPNAPPPRGDNNRGPQDQRREPPANGAPNGAPNNPQDRGPRAERPAPVTPPPQPAAPTPPAPPQPPAAAAPTPPPAAPPPREQRPAAAPPAAAPAPQPAPAPPPREQRPAAAPPAAAPAPQPATPPPPREQRGRHEAPPAAPASPPPAAAAPAAAPSAPPPRGQRGERPPRGDAAAPAQPDAADKPGDKRDKKPPEQP